MENLNMDDLMKLQVEQLEKEKRDLDQRFVSLPNGWTILSGRTAKKNDHCLAKTIRNSKQMIV
jgi:hypothetical protein